jgi:hypothetical protein
MPGAPNPGERNGRAKLTLEQARQIRAAEPQYGCGARLAREYGVSNSTIYMIRRRETWLADCEVV